MTTFVPALAAFAIVLLYRGLTGPPPARDRALARALRALASYAGLEGARVGRVLAASPAAGLFVLLVVAGLSGAFAPAAVFAAAAAWSPVALLRARLLKRRRALREAWPDAIAALVSGVRAGVALPEACGALGERGPAELQDGWRSFASTYRATGSFVAALDRLRDDLADPVADRVVAALRLAHEVGGTDLVRVLRTLADFVREDLRVRQEIEARWSWTVTAARVAAAAPWVVLLLMSTRPEAASAYNSSAGMVVVGAGAAASVVGYRLMLRAARLPEDSRLGA
jgi:tight adherence protein B